MSKPLIIFDYDSIIYETGFATETRQVEVTHLSLEDDVRKFDKEQELESA